MSGEEPVRTAQGPSIAELRAAAAHAERRLALYRRKTYLGRGDPGRLAELERIAAGAALRLRRATAPPATPETPPVRSAS